MHSRTVPISPARRRVLGTLSATALVLATALATAQPSTPAAAPPGATPIAWRQANTNVGTQGNVLVRRGVALFATGEPATMEGRLEIIGYPVPGQMRLRLEGRYRFDDGSGFVTRAEANVPSGTDTVGGPAETVIDFSFAEGTGRFAGMTGTVRLRSRTDLPRDAEGHVADIFAEARGSYVLAR